MTMQELLPCPFCGGRAEIERKGDRRQSTIYACTDCGCRLETGEEFNHGAAWNTRADAWRPIATAPRGEVVWITDGKTAWFGQVDDPFDKLMREWPLQQGLPKRVPIAWCRLPTLPAPPRTQAQKPAEAIDHE